MIIGKNVVSIVNQLNLRSSFFRTKSLVFEFLFPHSPMTLHDYQTHPGVCNFRSTIKIFTLLSSDLYLLKFKLGKTYFGLSSDYGDPDSRYFHSLFCLCTLY